MKEPLVKVVNLTKRYGKVIALNNISFSITEGITGIVGPNGAGKTTLINIITGLIDKTSGKVIIKMGIDDFRESIGVIRDIMAFPPELEVEYFLEKIAEMYGYGKGEVKKAIELTALKEVKHKKIGSLSMGYKKRLGIAQAIVHNPILIIADEPFTGLDPLIKVEIRDLLADLNKEEGINFFISSHDIGDLERISNKVLLINNGKIIKVLKIGEKIKVVITPDNIEKFIGYLKERGFVVQSDSTQVWVNVENMKNLFKALYEYEGQVLRINMASIEGMIRDELA